MKVKDFIPVERHLPRQAKLSPPSELVDNIALGIEIELENCRAPNLTEERITVLDLENGQRIRLLNGINAHRDGSLRNNGLELVTPPIRGDAVSEAIRYMIGLAREYGWTESNRAGIHVHVDVQNLEISELLDVLCTYLLVEPALFAWANDKRRDSIFCKAWADDGNTSDLQTWLQYADMMGREEPVMFQRLNSRYSALNLDAVRKYGTLEFRHLRTILNPDRLIQWCNLILKIRKYGRTNSVRSKLATLQPEQFLCDVFGYEFGKEMATSEYVSYFLHRCVPLAVDLFAPPPKTKMSWDNGATTSKDKSHPGFSRFMKAKVGKPKAAPPEEFDNAVVSDGPGPRARTWRPIAVGRGADLVPQPQEDWEAMRLRFNELVQAAPIPNPR